MADFDRIGTEGAKVKGDGGNVCGCHRLISRCVRCAVCHFGVHAEQFYGFVAAVFHLDHHHAGRSIVVGVDVNSGAGKGKGRNVIGGGTTADGLGSIAGTSISFIGRVVAVVVVLFACNFGRLGTVTLGTAGKAAFCKFGKAFLIVDGGGGVDVDLMGHGPGVDGIRQGQLEDFNALEGLSGGVGQTFAHRGGCGAILGAGNTGGGPVAADAQVRGGNRQRQAKVHHEGMGIVKGVVEVDILAVLTALDFDAGVIAVAVLGADGGHGRQVGGNGLGLILQVGDGAIGQVALPGVGQTDVLVKQGAALDGDVVGVEFLIGSLVNVMNRQRVLGHFGTDIVGDQHALVHIDLEARNVRFATNSIFDFAGGAGIVLALIGKIAQVSFIVHPDNLLGALICVIGGPHGILGDRFRLRIAGGGKCNHIHFVFCCFNSLDGT